MATSVHDFAFPTVANDNAYFVCKDRNLLGRIRFILLKQKPKKKKKIRSQPHNLNKPRETE